GVWADLGCGDGVFTALLAELLAPGSHIYGVDRDGQALARARRRVESRASSARVTFLRADFTQPLPLPPLDGMLLANALHFVAEKGPVLAALARLLKPGGKLVVVEYNTRQGNTAVPHPLHETEFLTLAQAAGFVHTRIAARAPSTFLGEMYTGVAVKPG
ncbi:MAG: class I SAM-dependent methyltransferase, partial [Caldilineae bacterium]